MDIENKDIWRDNKKYCIICEKDCCNSGIQIKGYFICEECIKNISTLTGNNKEYDAIVKKLNDTITSEILKDKK